MTTPNSESLSDVKRKSLLPPLFTLVAILPAIALMFLVRQPKEVTATIYSAYIAIIAVPVAVVSKKKGMRGLAIIAFSTCIVFTALFVIYAYIAFYR